MATTDVDDAITYVFRWRSSHDVKVCPKCNSLDGHIIYYNLFAPVLVSDTHGPVWDLDRDHSLAHGYYQYNCRCILDVEVACDWSKIPWFVELQKNLGKQGITIELFEERFKLSNVISEARNQMQRFSGTLTKLNDTTRETNQSLTLYLALGRRIGDENITRLITLFQTGRITAEMLIQSLRALTVAAGPWGWLLAAGQVTLSALMLADIVARDESGSEGPQ